MSSLTHILLVAAFIITIFGVPTIQAILDLDDELTPQALEFFERAPSESHLRDFEEALEAHSLFEAHGRKAMQWTRFLALRGLGEKAVLGEAGWVFYAPGVRYLSEPYFRDRDAFSGVDDDPVAAIVDMQQQLAELGTPLLVVVVPGKASIYPDRLWSGVRPSAEIWGNTTRLVAELETAGVDALALHEPLMQARRASGAGTALYMATDTHWTGAGAEIAAQAIAAPDPVDDRVAAARDRPLRAPARTVSAAR